MDTVMLREAFLNVYHEFGAEKHSVEWASNDPAGF
jgi:hypothetical protein